MIGRRKAPLEDVQAVDLLELQGFDDYDMRLGDVMRGERATLGKSLLDVQRELKIKASFITAIENADPSAFETPGFVAGYVRSYARYLSLDPEWAYAQFCKESGFEVTHTFAPGAALQPKQKAKKRPDGAVRGTVSRDPFENPNTPFTPKGESAFSRIEPGALGSVAVLALLIAGLGYGGWAVLQQVQQVQLTAVDQTPGVLTELDTIAPNAPGTEVEAAGLTPPPADVLDRLYRPQPLEVPVLTARDGPIATLDPSNVGAFGGTVRPTVAPTETVVAEVTPTPVPEPNRVIVSEQADAPVVMFAVRPSWVRVRSADGTVILEKVLDAGEQFVLPQTEEPPTLRAGNSGSVYFHIAGETYGPAGQGATVVKNVSLAMDDLRTTYTTADLSADADLATTVASILPTAASQ